METGVGSARSVRTNAAVGHGKYACAGCLQNAFHRLARCYERRIDVIDAFFDFADAIISVRSLIRRAWTTHRWDDRPRRRP